jgi:hypothetical protein
MGICLKAWISPLHASKSIIKLSSKHKSAILVVAIFIKEYMLILKLFFTICPLQNIKYQKFLCLSYKMRGGIMEIVIQILRMRCSEERKIFMSTSAPFRYLSFYVKRSWSSICCGFNVCSVNSDSVLLKSDGFWDIVFHIYW